MKTEQLLIDTIEEFQEEQDLMYYLEMKQFFGIIEKDGR